MKSRGGSLKGSYLGTLAFLALSLVTNAQVTQQTIQTERTCPSTRLNQAKTNPRVTELPTCPDGNGDVFSTEDGAHWTLQCCTHATAMRYMWGGQSVELSLKDCATKCSTTSGCQSVMFSAEANEDNERGTCLLFATGGFSTKECQDDSHDFAYLTAPPGVHSPDTLTVAPDITCPIINGPTTCPLGDGQYFKSQSGELFHMDCYKRHGTAVIKEDVQQTFQNCIDACSSYIPCHSVDYHSSSKKCYYGSHHGTPDLAAPGFQSAYSLGCVGVCGCGPGDTGEPSDPTDDNGTGGPSDPTDDDDTTDNDDTGAPSDPTDDNGTGGPSDPTDDNDTGAPSDPTDDNGTGGPSDPTDDDDTTDNDDTGAPSDPTDDNGTGGPSDPTDDNDTGAPSDPTDDNGTGGPSDPTDDNDTGAPSDPTDDNGNGGPSDPTDDDETTDNDDTGVPSDPTDDNGTGGPSDPTDDNDTGAPSDSTDDDICDNICGPRYLDSNCGIVGESQFFLNDRVWKAFCSGYSGGDRLTDTWVDTAKECIEKCTADFLCTHANWSLVPRSDGKRRCFTKKDGTDKSPAIPSSDYASIFLQGKIVWDL
ncbi:hypothetical protein N7504_007860 [Penicillium tannophilum]|nr:hypothetical protein N7504_007860 [Penicillium tannophilum]